MYLLNHQYSCTHLINKYKYINRKIYSFRKVNSFHTQIYKHISKLNNFDPTYLCLCCKVINIMIQHNRQDEKQLHQIHNGLNKKINQQQHGNNETINHSQQNSQLDNYQQRFQFINKDNNMEKDQYLLQLDKMKQPQDDSAILIKVIQKNTDNQFSLEIKDAIEKTLAEKFVTLGYGYIINMKAVKKRHKVTIRSAYYNNTMTTIVRKALRAIQNFLIIDCKQQNIKPLNHYQGSVLRSPMLQCTKWLMKNELDTFYKFIMRTYALKEVCITEDQANRLYGQLIQSARKGHEVTHIILQRYKHKSDAKNSQGFTFSYLPSGIASSNR